MKLVNLGISGKGNSFIAQRINEYIIENHKKIGLVCILWTNWERLSFYNHEEFSIILRDSTYASSPPARRKRAKELFLYWEILNHWNIRKYS